MMLWGGFVPYVFSNIQSIDSSWKHANSTSIRSAVVIRAAMAAEDSGTTRPNSVWKIGRNRFRERILFARELFSNRSVT